MTTVQSTGQRARSSGRFELPLPLEKAFDLFTAEGERRWVPGWSPEILGSLPQHRGLIFLTNAHGRQSIWTVLESDPATLTHCYSRVTPGLTAGIVEVRLRAAGAGCEVEVAYDLTALSPDGQAALADYRGEAFDRMLGQWRELITAALGSDQLPPT